MNAHRQAPIRVPALAAVTVALLSACAGGPPPADWQIAGHTGLARFGQAWLSGETRSAEVPMASARQSIASTGRLDLAARLELARCGYLTAGLVFECAALTSEIRTQATADDQAYARFLQGDWSGLEAHHLEARYRPLLQAKDAAGRNDAAHAIADPVSQLIAAALLLRRNEATPALITTAIDTASAQGWRRPLLAWLGIAKQRAEQAGDTRARAHYQQRISLIESSTEKSANARP